MKKDPKAFIALAIVSIFWGTTYLASRIGTEHVPGLFLAGIRQFISGLILVSFFTLKGYALPKTKDLKKIIVQGFFLLCVSNGLMTWAMQYISSGLGAIIAALVPVFIVIFSMIMGKSSKPSLLLFIGLILGFAGIGVIFYDYFKINISPDFLFGLMLSMIGVLSWSFGSVYASNKIPGVHILHAAGLQMLSSGLILLPLSYMSGHTVKLSSIDSSAWWSIAYLVVVGSLISYAAYVYVLTRLSPTRVSVYAYINPIVAVLLGVLVLNENFSMHILSGTVLTLGGVYLVNYESKKILK